MKNWYFIIFFIFLIGCAKSPYNTVDTQLFKHADASNYTMDNLVPADKHNDISKYFMDYSLEEDPRNFYFFFSQENVSSAEFLENKLILGKSDGRVEIWNIFDKQLVNEMKLSDSEITKIYVEKNYKYLICGTENGYIFILDLNNLKILKSYKAHELKINDILLTDDQKNLITCSDSYSFVDSKTQDIKYYTKLENNNIRVWDFKTGSLIKNLNFHTHNISDMALINENIYLLTSSWDGKIAIWNTADFSLTDSFCYDDSIKTGIGYYKNRIIGSNLNGEIEVWSLRNKQLEYILKIGSKGITRLLTKDNYLISSDTDNVMNIIDLDNEKIISQITDKNSIFIKSIDIDSNQRFIFSINENNVIKVWKKHFQGEKRFFLTQKDILSQKKKIHIPQNTFLVGKEKKDYLEIYWPERYKGLTISMGTLIPRKKLMKDFGVCLMDDVNLYNKNFSESSVNIKKGTIFTDVYYFEGINMVYVIPRYTRGFIPIEKIDIAKRTHLKYKIKENCYSYYNIDRKKRKFLKKDEKVIIEWIIKSKNYGYANNIGWINLDNLKSY